MFWNFGDFSLCRPLTCTNTYRTLQEREHHRKQNRASLELTLITEDHLRSLLWSVIFNMIIRDSSLASPSLRAIPHVESTPPWFPNVQFNFTESVSAAERLYSRTQL